MSLTITEWFVQQYGGAVHTLAQQKGSRLRRSVRLDSNIVGKSAFVDRSGKTTAQKRLSRHGDSPLVNTPHSRRRLDLADYEWGDLIDAQDKIRTLNDPTNPYTQAGGFAMGRAMDTEIIAAFDGSAFEGAGGAGDTVSTIAFPAAQGIAVDFVESGAAADSNLTVGKLRRAKEILDAADVPDEDPRFIAVTASQIHSLLNSTAVTSSDFNTVKALVAGQINTFLGFEFLRTQLLPFSSATVRKCFAYAQSGVSLGVGMDIVARLAERSDKSFAMYAYYMMSIGATRLEEERIVRILCDEDFFVG